MSSLSLCRLSHTIRVGACPVLEITAVYPCIRIETDPREKLSAQYRRAQDRFNEAYRTAAEAFLAWAQEEPSRRAMEDFSAMGAQAPYRFDRRVLTLDMRPETVPEPPSESPAKSPAESPSELPSEVSPVPRRLPILRTVRMGSRRGEVPETIRIFRDDWRYPEMILCPPRRRGSEYPK